MMMVSAFSVLSRSTTLIPAQSPWVLNNATTKVAPKSSNTNETVVDVGMPSVLKMSSNTMSMHITAMNMHTKS